MIIKARNVCMLLLCISVLSAVSLLGEQVHGFINGSATIAGGTAPTVNAIYVSQNQGAMANQTASVLKVQTGE